MRLLALLKESLLHLAFPHLCEGCGSDLLERGQLLCLRCLSSLPETHFHQCAGNPVEKIFWGRLPLAEATAQYYFSKGSLIRHLLHVFKYQGNRELGWLLGRLMGQGLAASGRFASLDGLVPMPLFSHKERTRGFNQAAVLCEGIGQVLHKPVWKEAVCRNADTESQTKKGRVARWQNMEGRFALADACLLADKHVLLVDDVVTTGATLEVCGRALLQAPGLRLSMATLCCAYGS